MTGVCAKQHWQQGKHKLSCTALPAPKATPAPAAQTLEVLCHRVLRAFEEVHTGLHGTEFSSASFSEQPWAVYVYERQSCTEAYYSGDLVSSYAQWLHGKPTSEDSLRAYWCFRMNQNCRTLCLVLLDALRMAGKVLYGSQTLRAADFRHVSRAVTLKGTGKIVISGLENHVVVRVPAAEDQENFHEWLEFNDRDGCAVVLDLTLSQFDIWPAGAQDVGDAERATQRSDHSDAAARLAGRRFVVRSPSP
eukprot:m51a1_g9484 hypothetical protein (249) ;mRNA; r:620800-625536